jgi:Protein of unknown function (DUF4244)
MFTPPRPAREFLLADDGTTTVEYVLGTLAAAAFAIILIAVIKDENTMAGLRSIIERALSST